MEFVLAENRLLLSDLSATVKKLMEISVKVPAKITRDAEIGKLKKELSAVTSEISAMKKATEILNNQNAVKTVRAEIKDKRIKLQQLNDESEKLNKLLQQPSRMISFNLENPTDELRRMKALTHNLRVKQKFLEDKIRDKHAEVVSLEQSLRNWVGEEERLKKELKKFIIS
jgi:HAMP domain-containing protein